MTSTTAAPGTATVRPITPARVGLATAAALALNLVVLWLGPLAGASMDVGQPAPVGVAQVVLFSVVPLVLASAVLALIARRRPGFRPFAALAGLAFAVLTCLGSFAAATDTATGLTLSTMHVVCGAAWLWVAHPGRGR